MTSLCFASQASTDHCPALARRVYRRVYMGMGNGRGQEAWGMGHGVFSILPHAQCTHRPQGCVWGVSPCVTLFLLEGSAQVPPIAEQGPQALHTSTCMRHFPWCPQAFPAPLYFCSLATWCRCSLMSLATPHRDCCPPPSLPPPSLIPGHPVLLRGPGALSDHVSPPSSRSLIGSNHGPNQILPLKYAAAIAPVVIALGAVLYFCRRCRSRHKHALKTGGWAS
jgi:hypothetical protein